MKLFLGCGVNFGDDFLQISQVIQFQIHNLYTSHKTKSTKFYLSSMTEGIHYEKITKMDQSDFASTIWRCHG